MNKSLPIKILALYIPLHILIVCAAYSGSIANLERLHISEQQKAFLIKHGFVETRSHASSVVEIYEKLTQQNIPVFITTDAVADTAHLITDYSIRLVETKTLYPELKRFTKGMLKASLSIYQQSQDKLIKQLSRSNVAFFSTALKLLDPTFKIPSIVKSAVNRELTLIKQHKGLEFRVLLSYIKHPSLYKTPYAYDDYSQYIPRGHYTRTETLKRYFLAMMFYGRRAFMLKPGKSAQAIHDGRLMTLQALLMVYTLYKHPDLTQLYRRIYSQTRLISGDSDDLTPAEYMRILKPIYGNLDSPDQLNNKKKLTRFIELAMRLRSPRILSGAAFKEDGDFTKTTKGFRLIGQRFVPDSYIFQNLVFDRVGRFLGKDHPFTLGCIPEVGCVRVLPMGLDVMAALGSKLALDILNRTENSSYEKYIENLNALKMWFKSRKMHTLTGSLYWLWFNAIEQLLTSNQIGLKPFDSTLYGYKKLQSALGSWVELRHDTILYAKQSYTLMMKAAMPSKPLFTKELCGYVEPYPNYYFSLIMLMEKLKCLVGQNGSLMQKINEFEDLLGELIKISNHEIEGKRLSGRECSYIAGFGNTIKRIRTLPQQLNKLLTSATDSRMAIVADVHTSPQTNSVVEEAIGNPAYIYLHIKDKNGSRVCAGAAFTYYEFKVKMQKRLTDRVWQKTLSRYRQPEWIGTILK